MCYVITHTGTRVRETRLTLRDYFCTLHMMYTYGTLPAVWVVYGTGIQA